MPSLCTNTQSIKTTADVTTELFPTLNIGIVENTYLGEKTKFIILMTWDIQVGKSEVNRNIILGD